MSERFLAWVAVRAGEDQIRVAMALMGLFIVIVWVSLSQWPERYKRIARRAFFVVGGLGYASILTVAGCTLVRTLFVGR